jgi:flagellar biosynthesis/type III secretory pathway M-ring protein FliF/YscJ
MMFLAASDDQVTPGVVAFFVVAALGVTLFLLIRSMNKQIARIEAPHEDDLRQADWEREQRETAEREKAELEKAEREKAEHRSAPAAADGTASEADRDNG